MSASANEREAGDTLSRGRVIVAQGGVFGIKCDGGTYRAERAVSCLVEPRVGDLVLVHAAEDAAYVLAVLVRPEPSAVRLLVEGDAELSATGTLKLRAPVLDVRASEGTVFIERLSYWGGRVRTLLGKVSLSAESVDSVVDRISERVQYAFRSVGALDQLRARRVDYRADEDMSLRAENAVVMTRKLVKIDGKQIHIG